MIVAGQAPNKAAKVLSPQDAALDHLGRRCVDLGLEFDQNIADDLGELSKAGHVTFYKIEKTSLGVIALIALIEIHIYCS